MLPTRTLDVVIPVFNEESLLPSLIKRLDAVFSPQALASCRLSGVRFVFVDDGSTDNTQAILADQIRRGWPAKLLCLSRNFGHQPAVTAGIDHADADLMAIMDADLQDPPELFPDMIRLIDEGFDVIFGERRTRQESLFKRMMYSTFYRLCAFLSEVPVPGDAGDFCLMRREVVVALKNLPEKLRFHRGLRAWIGFRQCALPYDRPSREQGQSKYSWSQLYRLATDGVASLSIRPLRITQLFLFLSVFVTLTFVAVTSVIYLRSKHNDPLMLWFLATQGLIAFTASLQLFSLYILGAYLGRAYLEIKSRPSYVMMKILGPPDSRS